MLGIMFIRQAPLSQKMEIIKSYAGEKPEDTLLMIKERFPIDEKDKRRKDPNKILIKKTRGLLEMIQKRKQYFSDESHEDFETLKILMKQVLDMI